jgi:two-component sensor histidine kinase
LESVPKKYLRTKDNEVRIIMYIPYLRAYTGTNELDKARTYCELLLKLVNNKEISNDTKSTVYRTVASYYIKSKNYPAAREQMLKNDSIVGSLGAFRISLGLAMWHKLDSLQGRFHDAYIHLLQYKKINDSIFNATKARQLQQIEVEYETAKKQDSIKLKDQDILLLTQKNELQQANLKQVRLSRNVTIAVVLMTFVIIVQLYRQYRQKQKSNDTITQKNEQLQHLLTEKEWLLKEIHHRVKNNLQIVMSLLNSQSAYIDNGPALTAIHDSQHRVHAMSLIHQKLYNTDNLSAIDVPSYIRELVSYLVDSFDLGQRVRFELAIETLEMDVSQAVPLGLILNEAITNAIKYAFPDERSGVISISLANSSSNHYLLVISDNGIGIPAGQTTRKPGSLGMSLMAGLSEDLDGDFSIENNNGTVIKISFVHELGVKRPGITNTSFVSNN